MSAAVLASAESSVTELTFVLLLRDKRRFPCSSGRGSDGIQCGSWHGGVSNSFHFETMVEYRSGSRAEALRLKCGGNLLVYTVHLCFYYYHMCIECCGGESRLRWCCFAKYY